MSIKVAAQACGNHSTAVDLVFFVDLVEQALHTVPLEATMQLQIRRVHIKKRKREPGIYAVGYDVHVPNSIELLLFSQEATGRPATLIAGMESRVSPVLEVLSPRLFESWRLASERTCGARRFVANNPYKLVRRGIARNNPCDLIKAIISSLRTDMKHDGGHIAYNLVKMAGHPMQLTVKQALGLLHCNVSERGLIIPVLHLLEQFGLVELPVLNEGLLLEPTIVSITDYCIDQAQAWVEEENARLLAIWQSGRQSLEKSVSQTERKILELETLVSQKKEELNSKKLKLETYDSTSPDLIASFEGV